MAESLDLVMAQLQTRIITVPRALLVNVPAPELQFLSFDTQTMADQRPDLANEVTPSVEPANRSALLDGEHAGAMTYIQVDDASDLPASGVMRILGRIKQLRIMRPGRYLLEEPTVDIPGGATATCTLSQTPNGVHSYTDASGRTAEINTFGIETISLSNPGDGYSSAPRVTTKTGLPSWSHLPETDMSRQEIANSVLEFNRQNAASARIIADMYEAVELVYTSKEGNRLILEAPHRFDEAYPANMIVEIKEMSWSAKIEKDSSVSNVRSIISNDKGSVAMLTMNRISDVCMNCRRCNDISVQGKHGSNIRVYKCLGHAPLEWNLAYENLENAIFAGASLKHVIFRGATMTKVDMKKSDVSNSSLARATMAEAKLQGAHFRKCDFTDAVLTKADLSNARFTSCDFSGATLNAVIMTENTRFTDCNFTGANLRFVNFPSADVVRGSKTKSLNSDARGYTGVVPTHFLTFLNADNVETVSDGRRYTVQSWDADKSKLTLASPLRQTSAQHGRVHAFKAGSMKEGTFDGRTDLALFKVVWEDEDFAPDDNYSIFVTDLARAKIELRADLSLIDMPNALGPRDEQLITVNSESQQLMIEACDPIAVSSATRFDI